MKKKFKDIWSCIRKNTRNVNKHVKEFFKDNIKFILIFFVIYFIALIPLIRANVNYNDDLGRVRYGYRDFGFGRHVSNNLSILLHGSKNLSDISPFTTILAVLIMAISSVVVLKILVKDKKIRWYHIVAALPIGMNPYFLQCYSFKFDAPYMALSVLFSVLPFVLYNKKSKNIAFIVVTAICTFLMAASYQASAGIFPMITIIIALTMFNDKEDTKEIFKFIYKAVIGYMLGLICFKLSMPPATEYYLDPGMLSLNDLIPKSIANYKEFYKMIYSDMKLRWLVYILLILITFIVTQVLQSKQKKYISLGCILISLILLFLMSFGAYPFLKNPIFNPRAMYGFIVLISLLSLKSVDYKNNFVAKVSTICLAYAFLTTSLIFGNAIDEQNEYNHFRINLLMTDLNNLDVDNKETLKVDLEGNVGNSQKVDALVTKLPILNRLLPLTLGDNKLLWQVYEIGTYYDIPNVEFNIWSKNKVSKKDMKLVKKTRYHSIYQKDNYVLIRVN